MRSYRCVSPDCGEVFDVERRRDRGMPHRVFCVFCGDDAMAESSSESSPAVLARVLKSLHRRTEPASAATRP